MLKTFVLYVSFSLSLSHTHTHTHTIYLSIYLSIYLFIHIYYVYKYFYHKVAPKRWRLEINFTQDAVLMLSSITTGEDIQVKIMGLYYHLCIYAL